MKVKNLLLLTVFLTGIASLVIEVVGVRMLSPYFGNTIFTVSSVISVFLAALSLGYYLGGIISEKSSSFRLFYILIMFSGIALLLGLLVSKWFLPIFGYILPITVGPLVSSIIAFLLPGILMGLVTPMAIKLCQLTVPKEGVGRIAGEMFFFSTCGSIFGSLATGFILIPHVGVTNIIFGTGGFLIFLGLIPAIFWPEGKKKINFLAIIIALWLLSFCWPIVKNKNRMALWEKDGIYEKITISNAEYKNRPVRLLIQDKSLSGAIYLDSEELVFDYTKYYNLYRAISPNINSALVIGGGAYSIPKAIIKDNPQARVLVSEIEPGLETIAKTYFDLKPNSRIITKTEDGRRLLAESSDMYDLIFSDVYYSYFSIPAHFTTTEFYELAKSRLLPNGVFAANIIGSMSKSQPSIIAAQIKTFSQVFPHSYFFTVDSPAKTGIQGVIFMGINGDKAPDWSKVTGLDTTKLINPEGFNLENVPVFTDDFTPTDSFTSKLFLIPSETNPGEEMMGTINDLVSLGPRYLTSPAKLRAQQYLKANLGELAYRLEIQDWIHTSDTGKAINMENLIARYFPERNKRFIVATHYDSKRYATNDSFHPDKPVPGANDSGSGTAMLLELARELKIKPGLTKMGIDLVFFDGEEGEEDTSPGTWRPIGSEYFVKNLKSLYGQNKPVGGVVIDMVCDKDLSLLPEKSSLGFAGEEAGKFWQEGKNIYPKIFSDRILQEIRDDHTTLSNAGIPSFLVIDFDYPYFHTTGDTPDKCSKESLNAVFKTLVNYLGTKT